MPGFDALSGSAISSGGGEVTYVFDVTGVMVALFGTPAMPPLVWKVSTVAPPLFGTPAIPMDFSPTVQGTYVAAFGSPLITRFTPSVRRTLVRLSGVAAARFGRPTL